MNLDAVDGLFSPAPSPRRGSLKAHGGSATSPFDESSVERGPFASSPADGSVMLLPGIEDEDRDGGSDSFGNLASSIDIQLNGWARWRRILSSLPPSVKIFLLLILMQALISTSLSIENILSKIRPRVERQFAFWHTVYGSKGGEGLINSTAVFHNCTLMGVKTEECGGWTLPLAATLVKFQKT